MPHLPSLLRTATTVVAATVLTTAPVVLAPPAAAADLPYSDQCAFPNGKYPGRPWSLQRVLLDELWSQSTGKGMRVAVIDTGVDVTNPQLTDAVDVKSGRNFLPENLKDDDGNPIERGKENGTTDTVGHGTKVAGIIAARPVKGTGFVGLAPDATIIPIQQNDAEGNGDVGTLTAAIRYAVRAGADVINISQDTTKPMTSTSDLKLAIDQALNKKIVVVASAGNDGLGGNVKETYPASYEGVLAVAASDRNNERAAFSQSGEFVGVAAPGVDMISTVPKGGHCSDNGTSFSAPYVAGLAALIKAKHPDWTAQQIVAQIEQTAERTTAGHDRLVGWGVVDPVRALTQDEHPLESPSPQAGLGKPEAPTPAKFQIGETAEERNARLATYVAVGAVVLVAGMGGTAVALRDARRRQRRRAEGGSWTR
ncbi:type VII secretion-associated serine protease mycosin [Streptomyces violaceochromogenes]|uniref:Type VII secretion-associated serine protease mycosin n=1 Tax=Streptomyces violaceochromogenes TaxID=67377 RepID=A0ABU6M7B1_9ACTN|nr:type VII secretion-associated serine protease mycosin [Streptomyces violaceochromogenes]MEC7057075.1 type VII secretion-associated serine protease mycosin [Streptomyces violaceochromogenes]GHC87446.1 type VII secretion-associated serine protease [Streptomyces violaceochromogenes]